MASRATKLKNLSKKQRREDAEYDIRFYRGVLTKLICAYDGFCLTKNLLCTFALHVFVLRTVSERQSLKQNLLHQFIEHLQR